MENLPTAPKYNFYNDDKITEFACIEILGGKFAEYKFHFTDVKFVPIEEESTEDTILRFNFELIEGALDDANRDIFNVEVASILTDILVRRAEEITRVE